MHKGVLLRLRSRETREALQMAQAIAVAAVLPAVDSPPKGARNCFCLPSAKRNTTRPMPGRCTGKMRGADLAANAGYRLGCG